jgi:hypothetical protein
MPLYRAVRLFPLAQRAPGEHEAAPFRAAEERRLKLRGAELARYQTRTFTVPPNIRDRRTRDGMQEAAANIHLISQGWVVRCAEENLAATMGAVCGGDFLAWGRPSPEGPWVPIPPDELAGLKAVKDAFGSEPAGPDVRNPGRAFFDVRVAPRRGVPLELAWRFFGPAELVDDIEAKELRQATPTAFHVARAAGEHVSLWLQDAAAEIASREARFDGSRIAPWVPASGSEVSAAIGDAIRWLIGELESGRLVADAWETKTGLSDGRASIPPEHWPSLKIVSWQDSAIARFDRTWRDVRVYAPLPAARPDPDHHAPPPALEVDAAPMAGESVAAPEPFPWDRGNGHRDLLLRLLEAVRAELPGHPEWRAGDLVRWCKTIALGITENAVRTRVIPELDKAQQDQLKHAGAPRASRLNAAPARPED